MRLKKILITGGMGYIGSHTILELLKRKDLEVFSIDNFINSKPLTLKRVLKISGKKIKNFNIDLCNLSKLRSVFRGLDKVYGIIHFAALKSVEESVQDPLRYYHNNITSLTNLLECCREFRVGYFVYSSSCSIYGEIPHEKQPVHEDTTPYPPKSPYAHSKLIGEEILRNSTLSLLDMNSVSLRYFNPAGADPSGHIGEDPSKIARNLVNVITHSAKGKKVVTVFGNDYPTRDGTCIRDYIHVSDIAKAHSDALGYLEGLKKRGHYEVFNLGLGKGVTVLEMIQVFEKTCGIKLKKIFSNRRKGDVMCIYSDNQKSRQFLGWEPRWGIEEMVKTAWLWETNR